MTDRPLTHEPADDDDRGSETQKADDPRRDRSFFEPMAGPTGSSATTEAVGDPDRRTVESGAEAGTGAGVVAGAAVAGPIGAVIGGAAGAMAGVAAESVDDDDAVNDERRGDAGSEGTGPVDPASDYVRD